MTKLEKMLSDFDAAQASVEDLRKEIRNLELDQARLEVEADSAAKEGNLTQYQAKRDQARLAADNIFVKKKQLEAASCLRTEKEAHDAWKEYADSYDRIFAKNWSAYEKARAALYDSFLALVTSQNAALAIREKIAACCGLDLGVDAGMLPGQVLDQVFPLKTIPDMSETPRQSCLINTPDTDFFLRAFSADLDLFNMVIRLHRSR